MKYYRIKLKDGYLKRRLKHINFVNGLSESVIREDDVYILDYFKYRFDAELLECDKEGNLKKRSNNAKSKTENRSHKKQTNKKS